MENHPCCASDPTKREELEQNLMKELENIPDDETLDNFSEILHSLSHPIRLKIAFLLLQRDHCVCEIVQQTQIPPNLLSHHLTIMRKNRIIKAYMQSKWKFYKIDDSIKFILEGFQRK